jgi:hypothetical protein
MGCPLLAAAAQLSDAEVALFAVTKSDVDLDGSEAASAKRLDDDQGPSPMAFVAATWNM